MRRNVASEEYGGPKVVGVGRVRGREEAGNNGVQLGHDLQPFAARFSRVWAFHTTIVS